MENQIEEIKNRLDIVEVIGSYIKLQKAGVNFRALCPFHSEKKPSFFVSPVRQIWRCFGCSKGGDVFKFVMEIEGVEFGDALRILAKRAGVELKSLPKEFFTRRKKLEEILETACLFYQAQLEKSTQGKKAKEYLLERKFNEESIKKWRLGWAPNTFSSLSDFLLSRKFQKKDIVDAGLAFEGKNGHLIDRFRSRIIFPVFDLNSQVVGFGGRIFGTEDVAKYINTPNTLLYDKSKIVYGLDKARLEARRKDFLILVEGYVDCILSHQNGFENTVAVSGTALSLDHLKLLQRYTNNLYFSFDMDLAGQEATKRGIFLAQQMGFEIKILSLPPEKDPADVISQDPLKWKEIIDSAKSIIDYFFELFLSRFDKEKIEEKKEIVKNLAPFILNIPNEIEKTFWLEKISKELKIKEEDLRKELAKIKLVKNEIATSEKTNDSSKSRREILEEKLLYVVLQEPSFLDKITTEDFIFFSSLSQEILKGLKEKKESLFPPEIKNFYDYLFLKSEIEKLEPSILEKEFNFCKKEIVKMTAREKLEEISKRIQAAEKEKNEETLRGLNKEFNFWAEKIK